MLRFMSERNAKMIPAFNLFYCKVIRLAVRRTSSMTKMQALTGGKVRYKQTLIVGKYGKILPHVLNFIALDKHEYTLSKKRRLPINASC